MHSPNVRQICKTVPTSHSMHAHQALTCKGAISHNTCNSDKLEVHRIWLYIHLEAKSQPVVKRA